MLNETAHKYSTFIDDAILSTRYALEGRDYPKISPYDRRTLDKSIVCRFDHARYNTYTHTAPRRHVGNL